LPPRWKGKLGDPFLPQAEKGALSGQQGSGSFNTRSRTFAISASPLAIFHSLSEERKWGNRKESPSADLPAQNIPPPGSGELLEFMNENENIKGGTDGYRLTEVHSMISLVKNDDCVKGRHSRPAGLERH
jgi:hypothetical protein